MEKYKAVFIDFYGTLVHEDDEILPLICERVRTSSSSSADYSIRDIGGYWWKAFLRLSDSCYGPSFRPQRQIGVESLAETIREFQSDADAETLIQLQFEHWKKPVIFEDTKPFLEEWNGQVPLYILSNIDTEDVSNAIEYHELKVDGVISSEDVQSYKPRQEMFLEGLRRAGLQPSEVLHIGDSINNDAWGAMQCGIDAVWLNRARKAKHDTIQPTYTFSDLNAVTEMMKGRVTINVD